VEVSFAKISVALASIILYLRLDEVGLRWDSINVFDFTPSLDGNMPLTNLH